MFTNTIPYMTGHKFNIVINQFLGPDKNEGTKRKDMNSYSDIDGNS